jgi:hypothetical protein
MRKDKLHPDDKVYTAAMLVARQKTSDYVTKKPAVSFYTPMLIHCTLPHSDPKVRDWIRSNGNSKLIVSSGINDKGEPIGVPYGSCPRLVLAYIITQVIQTKERRVEMGTSFTNFLNEIGYAGNFRGTTRASQSIYGQVLKLLKSNITYQGTLGEKSVGFERLDIARKVELFWDIKNPTQEGFWPSFINVTEDFFAAVEENPVPLRTDVLKSLRKSPLALDVYMWVSYRLFTLQKTDTSVVSLNYSRLQEQFGSGIDEANYRQFRREFRLAFGKVAEHWTTPEGKCLLNYELEEDRVTLFRSPLSVGRKRGAITAEMEAEEIFRTRRFDGKTMLEARSIAGTTWDVKTLAEMYFAWVDTKDEKPKFPAKHFLAFARRHCEHS